MPGTRLMSSQATPKEPARLAVARASPPQPTIQAPLGHGEQPYRSEYRQGILQGGDAGAGCYPASRA